MDIKEEEEIKKEFQLERVILFTDAVFAIILTIMVLDIKLPEGIRNLPKEELPHAFKELVLKLIGYTVTFFLVGRFWMAHLKLFRFLKDYDARLIVLNLFFLFSVTLFPFAVSLITGAISPAALEYSWGYMIYIVVFFAVIFTQALIAQHLIINKQSLCINTTQLETVIKWKIQRINLIMAPVIILIVLMLNYFELEYFFLLIPVILYSIVISNLTKNYYPKESDGPMLLRMFRSIKTTKV